eukprot:gene13681-biopygen6133
MHCPARARTRLVAWCGRPLGPDGTERPLRVDGLCGLHGVRAPSGLRAHASLRGHPPARMPARGSSTSAMAAPAPALCARCNAGTARVCAAPSMNGARWGRGDRAAAAAGAGGGGEVGVGLTAEMQAGLVDEVRMWDRVGGEGWPDGRGWGLRISQGDAAPAAGTVAALENGTHRAVESGGAEDQDAQWLLQLRAKDRGALGRAEDCGRAEDLGAECSSRLGAT